MRLTKVSDKRVRAAKISGTGAVHYEEWADENGNTYIGIVGNFGGGNKLGSFSSNVYKLDDVGSDELTGYDPRTGQSRITKDNNMSGFLRAARDDLVRRREEESTVSGD